MLAACDLFKASVSTALLEGIGRMDWIDIYIENAGRLL